MAKADTIFQSLKLNPSYPQAKKFFLKAHFSLADGKINEARNLATQAAQMGGFNAINLALLGKIYLQMGENRKALQFLAKADNLSPQNLERLCHIAVENARIGNVDEAKQTLGILVNTAPTAMMTKEAVLNSSLSIGDSKMAQGALGQLESSTSLISFWNSQAISLIKQDKTEQGVKIYKKALNALPRGFSDNRCFIRYNIALAYARVKDLHKARIYLEVEYSFPKSPVYLKVKSLLGRIHKSLSDNSPLVLTSSLVEEKHLSRPRHKGPIESELLPGQLCLWSVYIPEEKIPTELLTYTDPKTLKSG